MIPRARRAWADGDTDVSREQEQDARAVGEATPDPDAMAEAFGPATEKYSDIDLERLAREYYAAHGWPGQDRPPTPADLLDCETQE